MAVVDFRAAIGAKTRSQRIDRKVQYVPIGISEKDVLVRTQVLVQACDHLVLVASERGCRSREAWARSRGGHRSAAGIHDLRLDRGEIAPYLRRCWHGGGERGAGAQTEAFPAEIPEGLIPAVVEVRNNDGSTSVRPELVLGKRRPFLPGFVQEKIVCIENFVAEIFVRSPVQTIRTGLGAQVDHTAREFSPIGPQVTRLHFELLNRVLSGNHHRQVNVANVERLTIEVLRALISKRTIHLIVAPTKGVYAHRSACRAALRNYRRSQADEVKNVAAIQR